MAEPARVAMKPVLYERGYGSTLRTDGWKMEAYLPMVGFIIFAIYSTWAGTQGFLYHAPYVSPFCPMDLKKDFPALFGWFPFSPAFLVMWIPIVFRLTCYHFRRMYYRGIFQHPPSCAVGCASATYDGETAFPLVLQNLHRMFLYLAILSDTGLWLDFYHSVHFPDPTGGTRIGLGVGSLVLLVNAGLLTSYLIGCHALRHLVGGGLDCFSCRAGTRQRFQVWETLTWFNERHGFFFWVSMTFVGLTDLYIRLVHAGVVTDMRFF